VAGRSRRRVDRDLRLRGDQPADAHARTTRAGLAPRSRLLWPRHRRPVRRAALDSPPTISPVDTSDRHLRLLTETIAAVNSTLDLEEVLHLVANEVAGALEADACFVYLYDEAAGQLVLRATHGTPLDAMTRRPRLRPGEGITGAAAAERRPGGLAANAHLDLLWMDFPNLLVPEFDSIRSVPIP